MNKRMPIDYVNTGYQPTEAPDNPIPPSNDPAGIAAPPSLWDSLKELQNDNTESVDMVNQPPHYTQGGIECIDAIKAAVTGKPPYEAWLTGQIIKYIWRYNFKNGKEDLEKAEFYLKRLIEEQ